MPHFAHFFYLPNIRRYPRLRADTRRLPRFPVVKTGFFSASRQSCITHLCLSHQCHPRNPWQMNSFPLRPLPVEFSSESRSPHFHLWASPNPRGIHSALRNPNSAFVKDQPPSYHIINRILKPTVGLTRFFIFRVFDPPTPISVNNERPLINFSKTAFFTVLKKLFFVITLNPLNSAVPQLWALNFPPSTASACPPWRFREGWTWRRVNFGLALARLCENNPQCSPISESVSAVGIKHHRFWNFRWPCGTRFG